jgi:hypothetical protein
LNTTVHVRFQVTVEDSIHVNLKSRIKASIEAAQPPTFVVLFVTNAMLVNGTVMTS